MKTNLVRIGNSRGIRLPKFLIDQCHLKDEVELKVEGQVLTVCSIQVPRRRWGEAFSAMAAQQDDKLLDADTTTTTAWDKTEWQWS